MNRKVNYMKSNGCRPTELTSGKLRRDDVIRLDAKWQST